MKELTKAEEQIMHILWEMGRGFVKDVLEQLPEPKPAYNTVSTIIRILEKKGFVSYKAFGKTHEYYPAISKEVYTQAFLNRFVKNYFHDSYSDMVSFFTKDRQLSLDELEEMLDMIRLQIQQKKDNSDG